MNIVLVKILLLGTIAMLLPIVIQSRWYKIKLWKCFPIAFLLTVVGTAGTNVWYYIESGFVGGRSFFGAVFLVPVVFVLLSKLFRSPYGEIVDLCAPAECVMLAIMKVQCLKEGCCAGRVIYTTVEGAEVLFPSQIAEMGNAVIIFFVLMLLAHNWRYKGSIYPTYLILYGISRFVLNFFRSGITPVILGLSYGSFWALCACIIGITWLYVNKKKQMHTTEGNE